MDGDFAEKLKQVLSDPDAMSKITAIASGLGMTGTPLTNGDSVVSSDESVTKDAPSPLSLPASGQADAAEAMLQSINRTNDPRLLLLSSLKPLLREEKRERIDAITRALALASLMKSFRK